MDFLAHRISSSGLKGHEYVMIALNGGINTNVYKLFMSSYGSIELLFTVYELLIVSTIFQKNC